MAKSFQKIYKKQLTEAVEDLADLEDEEVQITQMLNELKQTKELFPRLKQEEEVFDRAVQQKLCERYHFTEEKAAHITEKVRKRTEKYTERDTYQAMEGFVHNLNTMHSRAGAQTPFFFYQLRDRYKPRRENDHPECTACNRCRAGKWGRHAFSQFIFLR